ncbi:MAG: hypothetical protein WBV39_02020, partial [Rudaea sp.]
MNKLQRNSICSAILVALGLPAFGRANTITVDGTTCTLANAIPSAQFNASIGNCAAGAGADTIVIEADQTLPSDQFLHSTIHFVGAGTPAPTITGPASNRLFWIGSPSSGPTISFENLTLSGGGALGGAGVSGGGGGAGLGGAVVVFDGNVSFDHVVFDNNAAIGGNGSNSIGNATGGGGGGGSGGDGG